MLSQEFAVLYFTKGIALAATSILFALTVSWTGLLVYLLVEMVSAIRIQVLVKRVLNQSTNYQSAR